MKKKCMMGLLTFCVSMVIVFSMASPVLAGSYTNQDVTAYVSTPGVKTASGATPQALYVAVHKNASGGPIFPFGTLIMTSRPLVINRFGQQYSVFNVQDTGSASQRTTYFFDIWYGYNTPENYQAALDFGVQKVNYTTH
jgi:3D (Asp-Asp-Asp) domain-containing protein